ncbi:MAG: enoyl-CoA hydratase/isomerase family protein [Vampirovibrionales bacterium]|nr:enoyl-CoA hydratase/isomerase family protein [Vampirovibrionales bacterium]
MPEAAYQNLDAQCADRVLTVRLNRPQARNALSNELIGELAAALRQADDAPAVGCIVLTGDEGCFSAGADIIELMGASPVSMIQRAPIALWECVSQTRKPVIAAVRGYALGGGLELALMCDIIIASDTARFALPEIALGLIPGAGGIQRLMRAAGKARAMELLLSGRRFSAQEALAMGLVSQLSPDAETLTSAQALAQAIAHQPLTAVMALKAAARQAFEAPLSAALASDRDLFSLLFASADAREGLNAFLERREPAFRHA